MGTFSAPSYFSHVSHRLLSPEDFHRENLSVPFTGAESSRDKSLTMIQGQSWNNQSLQKVRVVVAIVGSVDKQFENLHPPIIRSTILVIRNFGNCLKTLWPPPPVPPPLPPSPPSLRRGSSFPWPAWSFYSIESNIDSIVNASPQKTVFAPGHTFP